MKRILQSLAASLLTFGAMSGVAAAASVTCNSNISNTGTDSNNSITCVDTEENSVSCENNVIVSNSNDQSANSGGAFTTDNTSGGGATSGDSGNSNTTVVKVGASCAPVEVATTTPTVPTTPSTPSTPAVLGETTQVVAPVGGVGAGAGAGVASNKVAATAGLVASAGVVGLGLALKKRAFGRN